MTSTLHTRLAGHPVQVEEIQTWPHRLLLGSLCDDPRAPGFLGRPSELGRILQRLLETTERPAA